MQVSLNTKKRSLYFLKDLALTINNPGPVKIDLENFDEDSTETLHKDILSGILIQYNNLVKEESEIEKATEDQKKK